MSLSEPLGQIVAAHRRGKGRIHERHDRALGGRRRERHHGVDRRERRQPRIGILRRRLRHRQHRRQMHDAAKQDGGENPQQRADHEQPFRTIAGIGPSLVVPRGDADRRIVEPPHQHELIDPAGRQPIAGPRQRRHRDREPAVDVAHDFLAGEAVAIDRVGDEPAFRIVQRDRPIARRRRHAADA